MIVDCRSTASVYCTLKQGYLATKAFRSFHFILEYGLCQLFLLDKGFPGFLPIKPDPVVTGSGWIDDLQTTRMHYGIILLCYTIMLYYMIFLITGTNDY